jgi:hypothetical protein
MAVAELPILLRMPEASAAATPAAAAEAVAEIAAAGGTDAVSPRISISSSSSLVWPGEAAAFTGPFFWGRHLN